MTHPNVAAVLAALRAGGASAEVRLLPEAAPTAVSAAEQLGVAVGQIVNSLIFLAGGEPLLVLTSGAHRVDTDLLARTIDLPITRADAATVRAASGQPIGGVAPVGHPTRLRTLIDVQLAQYEVCWAAAGIPHSVFATSYAELRRLTGAEPVVVAAAG